MVYRLLMFVLSCSVVIAGNTTCIVGGSSAANDHAGWFGLNAVVGDAHSGNGEAQYSDNGLAVADNGSGKVRVTTSSDLSSDWLDQYANIENFDGSEANGRYQIIALNVVPSGADTFDLELSHVDSTSCDATIGGAVPIVDATYELQDVVDDTTIGSAAAQNVDILVVGTGTLTATIDWDTGGGTTVYTKSLIGVNSSYVDDGTLAKITTTANLANGLFKFATEDYFLFKNIDFDGGDSGAPDAVHCVWANAAGDGGWTTFDNCKFHNASTNGVYWRGNDLTLINCELCDNLGDGYNTVSSTSYHHIAYNNFHDNGGDGAEARTHYSVFNGNIFNDNGGNGLYIYNSPTDVWIISNTAHGNTGDGFDFGASAIELRVINNTSVDNDAYGYLFAGTSEDLLLYFAYNHASVNNSGHYDIGADATFVNFKNGNNLNSSQTAANTFVSVTDGSEDFTPKAGSDLIDAGLDVQGTPTMDIGATQLDAAGGGLGAGTTNKSGGKQ